MSIHLAIHISRTSVQVAEVLLSEQKIVREYSYELNELNPAGYRNLLQSIFQEITLKGEYDEYSLAWASPKHALIPLRTFNESSDKVIFQLLYGKSIDEQTIDFNRLMELSLVNVYEIPDWVKSFFIIRYPTVVIKHEQSILLRALFQKDTFKKKIVVAINDEYINVNLIHQNELVFANSFPYEAAEDVLYHLLFVLAQKEWKQGKGGMQFFVNSPENKKLAEQVIDLIKEHKVLQNIELAPIENTLKQQVLCV